ncbi:MAG: hypothetical protein WDM89_07205 [Rhizomicrobium sp.]
MDATDKSGAEKLYVREQEVLSRHVPPLARNSKADGCRSPRAPVLRAD